jgi:hypothetical protein
MGKMRWKGERTLVLPGKGPLAVTTSGLSVKDGLNANPYTFTYRLQIYWRQDGRLIYAGETSGGEYLIDGKTVKKKSAVKEKQK